MITWTIQTASGVEAVEADEVQVAASGDLIILQNGLGIRIYAAGYWQMAHRDDALAPARAQDTH